MLALERLRAGRALWERLTPTATPPRPAPAARPAATRPTRLPARPVRPPQYTFSRTCSSFALDYRSTGATPARCSLIYASVEIVMIICRDVALDTNGDECCKGRERSMCNPRYCWARRRREQWNQLHGLPDRAVVPRRVQFLCAMRPRDILRRGGVCVVHVVLLRQLRSSRKFAMLSVRGWI